jgi:uncharacterized protein YlbG (UPF0298 family)
LIFIDNYGIINRESKKERRVFMYINKSNVKVINERLISNNKFIISVTGKMNNGDYTSTFDVLNKEQGIKAIEELCKLHEWELASQDENGEIPNFDLCPVHFEFLEIPHNEFGDYCYKITDSSVYRIDENRKIYSVEIGEDFDEGKD